MRKYYNTFICAFWVLLNQVPCRLISFDNAHFSGCSWSDSRNEIITFEWNSEKGKRIVGRSRAFARLDQASGKGEVAVSRNKVVATWLHETKADYK